MRMPTKTRRNIYEGRRIFKGARKRDSMYYFIEEIEGRACRNLVKKSVIVAQEA